MVKSKHTASDKNKPSKSTSKEHWPRGIIWNGGFSLLGTPLCFSGYKKPELLFVAGLNDKMPRANQKILGTPYCLGAIASKKRQYDTLILEFERQIRLGRMNIRLLPSGLSAGGAQLEIEYKGRTIVYCSEARLSPMPGTTPLVYPKCDLLILDAKPAEPGPPSPKKTALQITDWLGQNNSPNAAALVCGNFAAVAFVTNLLNKLNLPVTAHRTVAERLKRIKTLPFPIPDIKGLYRKWPQTGVVLHLAHLWEKKPLEQVQNVAYVGPGRETPPWATIGFRAGESEDRPGLVKYALETGAKTVILGPLDNNDNLGAMLEKQGIQVHRIVKPVQLPLPF